MNEQMVPLDSLKTRPPFSSLFVVDSDVRDRIADDMQKTGFDVAHPLVVWNEGGSLSLIDGHTRLAAARMAGLREVPICEEMFTDDLDALSYALHSQQARRNLTQAELLKAVEVVDSTRRKKQGGDGSNQHVKRTELANAPTGAFAESPEPAVRSAKETAKIVGTSQRMVERVRTVQADPVATAEVEAGKSIYAASRDSTARKKANKMEAVAVKRNDSDDRDAPWTDAAAAGRGQEAEFKSAAKGLEIALEKLQKQGIDLPSYFAAKDQRVTGPWNRALKQIHVCARIMREAMRDSDPEE